MKTKQQLLDEIEAYFAPKIAQRQNAYNQYNQLVSRRDELVMQVIRRFDELDEIQRPTNNVTHEPTVS